MSDGREFWPMATVYVETTLPNGRPVAYFTRVDVQAHDSPDAAMLHALVMVDRALLRTPARPSVRRTLGRLLGRLASAVSP